MIKLIVQHPPSNSRKAPNKINDRKKMAYFDEAGSYRKP